MKPLRSIARGSLAEQAAAALRDYIVTNKLARGTQLPAEPVLAKQLGVSRNVLRQAVASLQAMGFLHVNHGNGTFVADPTESDVFQQLAAWMRNTPVREEDYLEVRAIWERGVYQLVLERASDDELDRLESLAHRMEEEAEKGLHDAYHEALLEATGNEFLVTLGMLLNRFFFEFVYRDAGARKPPEPRLWTSHGEVLHLLRRRDPAAIPQMVELHLAPHLTSDEHGSAAPATRFNAVVTASRASEEQPQ